MIWKEKYKLGVPIIDQQHLELFERVTEFVQTLRSDRDWDDKAESVNATLAFMKSYVVTHFTDEEEFQQRIGYPEREAHHRLHLGFMEYVADVAAQYEQSGYCEQPMQQFAGRLLAWLINHVVTEDQKIADYVRSKGGAA